MNGKKLKEIRKKLGFTQTELAEFIGRTSMRTVQNWESETNRIPEHVEQLLNEETHRRDAQNGVINTELIVSKDGNRKPVPYYDVDFAGGWSSEELFSQNSPSFFISNPEFNKAEFACNLIGNSISKIIPNRAILGLREVQNWQIYFPTNEIYGVVLKNNLRTVKIVKRSKEKDGFLELIPDAKTEFNRTGYEIEIVPMDFVANFYQVVAWAYFDRLSM